MYKFSQSLQSSHSRGRSSRPAVQLRERPSLPPPLQGLDLIDDVFGPGVRVSPTISPSRRTLPLHAEEPADSQEYERKKQEILRLMADPEIVAAFRKVFVTAPAE